MEEPIKAVLIGAGNRGMTIYGDYALKYPHKLKFIAVAEPIDIRRKKFSELHNISDINCFESYTDLLSKNKLADLAFICTQDQMHINPTIKALDQGYDVLLEKPMAHTLEGCLQIVKKAEETGKLLGIGHVLRYAPFFSKIYETIQDGLLGELINITHSENVSWYHMAHSFVRGNWSKKKLSSPMILAKCCHDLDLLYWMVGSQPKFVQSVGNLMFFKSDNAPDGAPKYCVNNCVIKDTCLYYAPRIYIDIIPILQIMEKSDNSLIKFFGKIRRKHPKILKFFSIIIPALKQLIEWKEWPVEPLYHGYPEDYSDKAKLKILESSPYGRCVYQCDNDVVDHQLVNIEFLNGVTANLTMHGFSESEGRTIRIDGTKATLKGEFMSYGEKITLYEHLSGSKKEIYRTKLNFNASGHGGGDFKLIDDFLKSFRTKDQLPLTNARAALESHLMAFAAEDSRLNKSIVEMENFKQKVNRM